MGAIARRRTPVYRTGHCDPPPHSTTPIARPLEGAIARGYPIALLLGTHSVPKKNYRNGFLTDKFNFCTALGLYMLLPTLFLLSFVAGFLTMWLATPDPNDTVVFIEDEEAFHQACFNGMRRGIQ